ncbi:hypothetical protein FRB94_011380 [Tulasnella sp. JGI-2019a]|nr:hypothetical protein FRB94_011380 [Tulasnella sp. JGI-2019a]
MIWNSLRHTNVLLFLGVAEVSDATYLVSPWMEHGDFHDFVASRVEFLQLNREQRDELDPRAIFYRTFNEYDVIAGIVDGITYLHANNIIHGDLKAANILLDDVLHPKICDFGLTKVIHTECALTSASLKGAGSYRWMSPELLIEGENAVKTTASDIYAFGMTIAEILSAQLPFSHIQSALFIALAVIAGQRPQAEPLTREGQPFQDLWCLADSCWKSGPSSRPTSDDMVATLARGDCFENRGVGQTAPVVATSGAFRHRRSTVSFNSDNTSNSGSI